jgi:acyl-CoA dehydrogenase
MLVSTVHRGTVATVWDFETDPEYQKKLDWVEGFMVDEVEPLDLVALDPYDKKNAETMAVLRPLQQQVKDQGLWAAHLRPELGGQGYGQVKLALLNEILGRSRWAPSVFGCQAPDSGNAEILALFGTEEQKSRYLQPLLSGEITSCYSMTEPQGGSDPGLFVTRAERRVDSEGDCWVINGEKWFSSNARHASFLIVMAVTKPEARTRDKMSLFIVPAETPGIEIVRNVGVGTESSDHASHGYVRYTNVRVPLDHVLGGEGQAFAIAQTRLGGGRIHHAMRTIALARRAFDMMCERAVSRQTRFGPLSDLQMTQEKIADSWIQIEQFRLLVLRTAWLIDKHQDYQKVRRDIAAVKVAMPQVLHDVVQRAMHLHGALGVSNEMPFVKMMVAAESLGIADGATELHKMTVARRTLREYQPVTAPFPSQHLPTRRAEAEARLAERLEHVVAEF